MATAYSDVRKRILFIIFFKVETNEWDSDAYSG